MQLLVKTKEQTTTKKKTQLNGKNYIDKNFSQSFDLKHLRIVNYVVTFYFY